jgi:flagellar protein FlbT
MKKTLRISLRAGERIYINGAVLRPDRKVSLEFLNDVAFLLESHVMHVENTTTPLRQLYFVVQTMLMDPTNASATKEIFEASYSLLIASFENETILEGLKIVGGHVRAERVYEALKIIRTLFPLEDAILGKGEHVGTPAQEVA